MDQLPRSNEGFANSNLFADSQQYNAYDNLFQTGAEPNSYDASWGINASNYPGSSRAQHAAAPSNWQNANHLSAPSTHANINGQASQYGRSLSHSPAPYNQNAFNNYGAQQSFQYRQPQYDPTLVSPHAFTQGFNYSTTNYQTPNAGTIAPHALEHETRSPSFNRNPYEASDYHMGNTNPLRPNKSSASSDIVDQRALVASIPNGNPAGHFSIINFDDLAKATKSERMGSFVNIGIESCNWDVNRAALPSYAPRKSRNDLRKIAGNDPKLLAKLGKKSAKREKTFALTAKAFQTPTSGSAPSPEKIKYEAESSSDEESSSSEDDEDSSYTSDDASEISPLPSKRPETPKEATEYDTIKALWRGRRKRVDSESIRKGLVDFWEIVKTIRDRWKADATAVTEAESKNRASELPLLKSRVKDQRDMMESAFRAALKHGNRDIIELFSENAPLLYVCYQFLLDRTKAEDYNSALPRVLLETMTLFTTLGEDKMEKTHLGKVLPRFAKKGDAKTQFYAKRIIANAAAASKNKAGDASAKKSATKEANAPSPASKRLEPEPIAGVKRSATTEDGGMQKKAATAATKSSSAQVSAKQNGVVKKQVLSTDTAKTQTVVTAKHKQVVAKPSGLFSSLQSAAKKPGTSNASKTSQATTPVAATKSSEKSGATGTQLSAPKSTFSFAQTMANLSKPKEDKPTAKQEAQATTESPEEKAKRLRKESRRHLHVTFKSGEDLVQVRVFHHDPEEELGHDASQVRDVADVGGEGRMFKQQHQMMDIDDEDEAAEEEQKLLEYTQPREIDFSDVDREERKRNYAPYGGGELKPESAERAVREHYEANNLIVFYTDASDIPPNPREPSEPTNGDRVGSIKKFGRPEEKWLARARQRKAGHAQQYNALNSQVGVGAMQGVEYANPSNTANNHQFPHLNAFPAPQTAPPSNDAISNILATLKQAQVNQATPPPPPMGGFGNAFTAAAPIMNTMQPQQPPALPTGQPDLAAILAQISQTQPNAAQAPQMGGFGYNAAGSIPNMLGYTPQMQQPTTFENPERKQWRERGNDNTSRDKRQNASQNPYYRTKICKYWQEGRCQKGDQCTYKHEES